MKQHISFFFLILLSLFGGISLTKDTGNINTTMPALAGQSPAESSAGSASRFMTNQAATTAAWRVYLPNIANPPELPPMVNTQSRAAVKAFYQSQYLASEGVSSGWSGDIDGCEAGSTSAAFQEAVLRRINYFRAMAGIPAVQGFDDVYNEKAQAAALMLVANDTLSHSPDGSWDCYSQEGEAGASSSNLYLGAFGPPAISGYIADPGNGNNHVGHRRWILYPQTRFLGTGDIPPHGAHPPANVLWVYDQDNLFAARPETREGFVAWPPPGYVPTQVIYPKWSFSYPHADFTGAAVSLKRYGAPVAVRIHPLVYGRGENTLVWEPVAPLNQPVSGDIVYNVTIRGVKIDGLPHDFAYTVTAFDPLE